MNRQSFDESKFGANVEALQEAYRENQRLIVENAELKREIAQLREEKELLESQLLLNLQNVRYLFLHGGSSH